MARERMAVQRLNPKRRHYLVGRWLDRNLLIALCQVCQQTCHVLGQHNRIPLHLCDALSPRSDSCVTILGPVVQLPCRRSLCVYTRVVPRVLSPACGESSGEDRPLWSLTLTKGAKRLFAKKQAF